MGEKRERYQNRIELLQGTLDLLILQTLQWGPQHGYGISVAIRNRSGKQKWVKAEWRISENKQRAKFYQLTAEGKKQLTRERSKWSQLSDAIAGVLQLEE